MDFTVKIKKLSDNAVIPAYATDGAAACDLCYAGDAPLIIEPGGTVLVPTGLAISMGRDDTAALIYARSGLASKHGISPANCVGVIDSDYRGEIKVPLHNRSDIPFTVDVGDRIAQMIFTPVMRGIFKETDELDGTARGEGGFGSTGVGKL